ncbi:MAG TPA: NAD-dependent epimerase/dehydratase family protein, partial [Gemmatimonadales bacterium]|nr:NAD-dependent epimerase/dehydratase family protein [Gemmatimonadales bacterium]
MRVLVTGADGFVGRRLVGRLVDTGHEVTAACRPAQGLPSLGGEPWSDRVRTVPLELEDEGGVR